MKLYIRFCILILRAFLVLAFTGLGAQSSVTISLNPNHSDDFDGVRYEILTLLDGNYFRISNQPLLRIFSLLGIQSLRIGGNTSNSRPLPSQLEIASAIDFANTANLRLIYGLRLKTFDPPGAAATANFILSSSERNRDSLKTTCAVWLLRNSPWATAVTNLKKGTVFKANTLFVMLMVDCVCATDAPAMRFS